MQASLDEITANLNSLVFSAEWKVKDSVFTDLRPLVRVPSKEYNVLELHFAFTDSGVNSYRSEKDITVVFPMGASDHEYDEINDFIGAINTAAGTSIATI